MKYLFIVFISLFICCCQNGKRKRNVFLENTSTNYKSEPKINDFAKFFTAGDHTASIITYKQPTTEQKNILKKVIKRVKENPTLGDEIDDQLKNPNAATLKKMGKILGLSDHELSLFVLLNKKETLSQKGHIFISKVGNLISFKGKGNLSILDSLRINADDSTISFKGIKLDSFHIDSSFRWNRFLPQEERLEAIHAFLGPNDGLSGLIKPASFTLYISRLSKSHKTYIYLITHVDIYAEHPFDEVYSIIID